MPSASVLVQRSLNQRHRSQPFRPQSVNGFAQRAINGCEPVGAVQHQGDGNPFAGALVAPGCLAAGFGFLGFCEEMGEAWVGVVHDSQFFQQLFNGFEFACIQSFDGYREYLLLRIECDLRLAAGLSGYLGGGVG